MPEKFLHQMERTHNTAPVMNARRINDKNLLNPVGLGGDPAFGPIIGVILGFKAAVTAPTSSKVLVTRGIAVGPDGEEIRVAMDPTDTAQDYAKALTRDFQEFDVRNALKTPGGSAPTDYDGIDPATHQIMITLDMVNDRLRAHKVTNAEAAAFAAAIAADGDAVDPVGAGAEWDAATADHAARGRVTMKNPDDLLAAATKVANEFILAFAVKDVAGSAGVITTVTMAQERRQPWSDMDGLA
jgi:hypothetical protein